MSSLNIYYQTVEGLGKRDFKTACTQSDYDIVCITWSMLSGSDSDEEIIDTNIFNIFRLDYDRNVERNYHIWGSFIAVRKHLGAYVRREWMMEGVECVWVTVPPRGCNGYLHVACGRFSRADNIDPFIETLTSVSKRHSYDKFVVTGLFPPFKGGFAGENLIMKRLYNSTSLAGLGQFNKVKNENDHLHNLVFSSVPVVVIRCPDPLVPEKYNWGMALEFDLEIDLPEYDKTTIDVTEENCGNIQRGLREAHEEVVNASGDVSELVDTLKLHLNLIGEKFEQTVKELKGLKGTSKGNVPARGVPEFAARDSLSARIEQRRNSKKLANIEHRLRIYADDVKRFGNMAERLKKVEDDSRKFAYLEGRLMMLEERVYPYYRNGWGWPRTTFPFNAPFGGSGRFGTAQTFGVTPASSQQQGFGQSNMGSKFGGGAHTGSSLFGQPSTFGQNALGPKPNGTGFGGFSTANAGTALYGAAPQPSTGLFGAAPQPSTGLFEAAQPPSTGLFGAAPQPSAELFGAAPQPSTRLFGQQSAALQTTGVSGSSGNTFGSTNNQPTPSFGATSSGTNVFGIGNTTTQTPGTEMLGAEPAAGGFSLPQTTSSGYRFGGSGAIAVQPAAEFFGGAQATTSAMPAFGTTTAFGDTSLSYGVGADGFGTSMSCSSNLFGGGRPENTMPGLGFGTPQRQTRGLDGVMDASAIPSTFGTAPLAGVPTTFSKASFFGGIKTTSASPESQITATTLREPAPRATAAFAAASSAKPTSTSKPALVSSSASSPVAVTTSNKPATVGAEVRHDGKVRAVSPFTASTLKVGKFIQSFPARSSTFNKPTTANKTESIPRILRENRNGEIATNPEINTTTESNAGNLTQNQKRVDPVSSSEFSACAGVGAQDSVRENGASSVTRHTPKPGVHVAETPDGMNCCKDVELKNWTEIKGLVSELISQQYKHQNLNITEWQTMVDCLQKLILNADSASSISNGVGGPTTNDSPHAESNNDKYTNMTFEVRTAIEILKKKILAGNTASATDDGGIESTSDTNNRENENEFANTDEIIRNVKRSNEELIAEDSAPTIYTGEGVAASDTANRETDNKNSTAAKIETTTERHDEKPNSDDALSTTNTSDTIVSMYGYTIVETENGSASTRHGNEITSESVTVTETSNDEVTAVDNASNADNADGISTSNDKSIKELETKM